MSKRTAVPAEAGAAASTSSAPAEPVKPVTSTEPAGGWPPDQYTGIGGTYMRDPVTGIRTPVQPEAPATGDTPAAA